MVRIVDQIGPFREGTLNLMTRKSFPHAPTFANLEDLNYFAIANKISHSNYSIPARGLYFSTCSAHCIYYMRARLGSTFG
jgi:hypothetical protein